MWYKEYSFEACVLINKVLKLAKKQKVESFFKEGFSFKGRYFIGLEKINDEKALFIEDIKGGYWVIPLTGDPKEGRKWWPDDSQIPGKEVINILKSLYAFLKA